MICLYLPSHEDIQNVIHELDNNCIFPEKISLMITLSQDLWPNSTQPGLMISVSQILGKHAVD